jgi:hypothetical protein
LDGTGIVGIDLDGPRWADDEREPTGEAMQVVERFGSYAERSILEGVHILQAGDDIGTGKKNDLEGVEVYSNKRFFIVTGNQIPDTPKELKPNPAALRWVLSKFFAKTAKTDRETEETEITEKLRDRDTEAIASVSPSLCLSVSDAIRLTIPNSEGQRNRKLFDFARSLKGLDEFKTATLVKVKPVVRQWHTAALPFIGTKDFDTTWMEFGYAWDRVRTAMGSDPLAEALIRARAAVLPPEASDYDSENSRLLVKLCIELQRISADQPFFLSCRSAGALLGIDHDCANRMLLMLVRDGILKLVRRGNEHRANRFLYTGGAK